MTITEIIRKRRSIFPEVYIEKTIPDTIVEEVLENANWAPTHKRTEPWRFKVFRGEARQKLSNYLASWYKENTPPEKFLEKKYQKNKAKPLQSDCVIAICMQRDPKESIPEWEEVAAVACAVQNMWLTCTAYDIGSYWSSTKSMLQANEFLNLQEGESCLGLFFMGYYEMREIPGRRKPIEHKVVWM